MRASAILALTAAALTCLAEPDGQERSTQPSGMTLRLELFVDDLDRSIEFYTKVLGFDRLEGGGDYEPVQSGSVLIGLGPAEKLSKQHYFNPRLQTSRRGLGTEIVLEVDNIQGMFDRVKASRHRIMSPLRKRPWGATDFRIADPDGYYLRITSR